MPPAAHDTSAADLEAVVRAGALPVPLTVTEVRELRPLTPPVAAGLVGVGLAVGVVLGGWWRGRRRA
jgi:preprotein translocase subunit SecD